MGKLELNIRATVKCLEEVKLILSDNNYKEMIREYKLVELLYKLENSTIQTPTQRWLVTKGSVQRNEGGPCMWTLKFNIGGQHLKFGRMEFALLTGLGFGECRAYDNNVRTSFQYYLDKRIENKKNLSFRVLTHIMHEEAAIDSNSVELRKLCVMYLIHRMVFFLENIDTVYDTTIRLVDDPDIFNSYPWGAHIYEELLLEWGMLLKTNAVNFKLKTFPFVIQAWVLECLPHSFSSILARKVGNGYPRMVRWHTKPMDECRRIATQSIYDAESVLFGDLTPDAEELEIEYYKSTLTWVKQNSVSHEIPAASVPEPIDEDNIPGFLTSAFIKIEKKLEVGFKKIETRLDSLETRLASVETRVANMEHSMSDGRQMEDQGADINPSLETSSPFSEPHHPTDFQYDHTKWSIKRKLLVLDINGLLVDIVSAEDVSQEKGVKPDLIIGRKAVFKRPFCDEFLEFCFERFSVGVWSSRVKKNVDSVLNFLMGKERQNLLFCWDQSQCTCTGYSTPENEDKPLFFKNLNKLWENCENDLPWKRGDYDEFNTILLDDSPYKALLNPPNTAIFPYTYQFSNEKDNALGPHGDLRIYLEGLSMALNVQEYVKQNPYGQDPITENHAHWSFYREVIEYTVLGSLRDPSSEKLQKDVSQVISTSVVAESSKVCLDNNGAFQQLEAAESNRQLMKNANADDNSAGSPSSIQRGCKRGRGSRSQSPRHETSRECCSQGRCLRGTSCRFVHHQSHRQSHADRRFQQHGGDICEHKSMPRECYEFIQGKCKWGGSCRFLHSVSDNADLGSERNETHGKQLKTFRSAKAVPRECNDFIRGRCKWGASCRYLHSVPDKTDRFNSFHYRYYQD